ncbi:hypothetical protein [Allokutzneria oryzae]|uniref:Resolvase/invertase-type recombinase catalytic domain-containing protein n=1 Tax=Allokutzneria oryzae TaxID=1378989 RepID=A0ABV5ZPS3_9PSEU
MRAEILDHARENGFLVGAVFTDHDPGEQQPGFVALLDVLALPHTYAVILPGWQHLAADPDQAAPLTARISRTATRILTTRPAQPDHHPTPAPPPWRPCHARRSA